MTVLRRRTHRSRGGGEPGNLAAGTGSGHEGLTEAQRYPRDFNGIIAGAPASITQELNTFYQPWLANVDWTPAGTPILTAGQLPLLHQAVLAACDGNDGQVDGQMGGRDATQQFARLFMLPGVYHGTSYVCAPRRRAA